jgi:hypothetical protein
MQKLPWRVIHSSLWTAVVMVMVVVMMVVVMVTVVMVTVLLWRTYTALVIGTYVFSVCKHRGTSVRHIRQTCQKRKDHVHFCLCRFFRSC